MLYYVCFGSGFVYIFFDCGVFYVPIQQYMFLFTHNNTMMKGNNLFLMLCCMLAYMHI